MEPIAPLVEDMSEGERTIWRYMDLPRFVSMLSTCRLWFSKAATLHDDPYEGFGKAERFVAPSTDDVPKPIVHKSGGVETNISFPQMMANLSQVAAKIFENAREHLYVNSWCLGAESMAMWEIYGSRGFGVAVKSSVGRYQQAARFQVDFSHYLFGTVNYHPSLELEPEVHADFRTSIPVPGSGLMREVLKLGLHKRECYWYESEWRAVLYQDHRPEITGVHEKFDLEQLVSEVYVGPRAQDFLVDVVSSIMEKYEIQKPLRQSDLLRSPPTSAPTSDAPAT